jgi:hypothetical protein
MSNFTAGETSLADFQAIFILIIIATFTLNLYIVVIIATNKKLHVAVNIFTVSLCAVGIVIACINMPFQLVYLLDGYEWYLGLNTCIMWYIFDLSACTVSMLNFIVITFIRYMAIIKPQDDWAPKKVQVLFLCLIWIVPFVLWSISLSVLMNQSPPEGSDCYLSVDIEYSIPADVFAFLIPLVLLIALNFKLILELRKRTVKVLASKPAKSVEDNIGTKAILLLIFNNFLFFFSEDSAVTTTIIMITKKTSGLKVPFKKEKKAILALVILQIGFLVCWMPFIVVFPMVSRYTAELSISMH